MSNKIEILEAYNAPVDPKFYVKLEDYVALQSLLREARELIVAGDYTNAFGVSGINDVLKRIATALGTAKKEKE